MSNSTANAAGTRRGKSFNRVCTNWRQQRAGVNKTGPSLFGVYGRKAGSTDFPRYKGRGLAFHGIPSDGYLQDPKAFVTSHTQNKTTAMTYSLKNEQQRADVIAYLQTLKK